MSVGEALTNLVWARITSLKVSTFLHFNLPVGLLFASEVQGEAAINTGLSITDHVSLLSSPPVSPPPVSTPHL